MGFKDFTIDGVTAGIHEGEILKVDGKNYKVAKVTRTAVSLTRHYWFDTLWSKLWK